jgi:CRISPR/Cas system-associated exonuclease Cas4 (RecB family)
VSLDAFARTVRQILETGNFAVDPDASRKSCTYCEYDPVCRRGQRNARKPRS